MICACRSQIIRRVEHRVERRAGAMSDSDEIKFGKSQRNRGSENAALDLMLQDPRFAVLETRMKRRLLDLVAPPGNYGPQTFDLVMGDEPLADLADDNLVDLAPRLRLVEMKATRKRVLDHALAGFFFGATEREYDLARTLGDRYLFAFVVLNGDNVYGRPFFVLLTHDELEARTQSKRVQYQVNLRTRGLPLGIPRFGVGPAGALEPSAAHTASLWNPPTDGS